jgi:predicted porin
METMKFNLWFAAGILAIASISALAQSVTIYGVIDTGVEHLTHANANGDGLARIPSITGELPSRIGFKGTEDLGAGNRALFVLENGFNVGSSINLVCHFV